MKIIRIIIQIAVLYAISFIGEVLHDYLHIPLPGSIIGLLLLLVGLSLKIIPAKWIENGAGFILAYLPIFFIPATVGVMNYPSLFSWSGVVLIAVVVCSTIVTMIAAGTMGQFHERLSQKRLEKKKCNKQFTQSS
ncbi:CidA/LrgA family protein [Virgibacillus necropolis]|uniref:CidA/LrgA family protein n=1 Tax=Virgibacillus necropolis TaxID=163877 RepID=A0A221MAI5_9BACI|nr:CidA/LrgA family holin-like protein [Virgibacillus necropolis]ASN04649.1 hypothetical protein CFK40_06260 [Virgibacillus necropolis]